MQELVWLPVLAAFPFFVGIAENVEHQPTTECFYADQMLAAVHDELADRNLPGLLQRIADDRIALVGQAAAVCLLTRASASVGALFNSA